MLVRVQLYDLQFFPNSSEKDEFTIFCLSKFLYDPPSIILGKSYMIFQDNQKTTNIISRFMFTKKPI